MLPFAAINQEEQTRDYDWIRYSAVYQERKTKTNGLL